MNKSILDMVRETAEDLHGAGVMKETTLREFDTLCLPPVKEYTAIPDQEHSCQKPRQSGCVRGLPEHQ